MEVRYHEGKSTTAVWKAIVEEESLGGVRLQAELIGFSDSATYVSALEKDQMYEFDGTAIQPSSDKNGVAFKWVKGAAKNKIIASDTCLRSAEDLGRFLPFGKSDHQKLL